MKMLRLMLFALIAGCATLGNRAVEIEPDKMLALSQGPGGSFAVWESNGDLLLGYYEPYAVTARPICSLLQVKKRGHCKAWDKVDYVDFQQTDVGSSWWVSNGGAPMVAFVSDEAPHPNVRVVDFNNGSVAMLPFVHQVWTRGEQLHVANARRSWALAQGEEAINVHALLVPCKGESRCFQVSPPREAGFDVPLNSEWEDGSYQYNLEADLRVEAVTSGDAFQLIVEGLGAMPVMAGSTCRTKEGGNIITCAVRGRTSVGLLEPGLPSTELEARGAVVQANGKYWFANAQSLSMLNPNGDLLAVGEPMDFHSGIIPLSGQCDPEIYELARETAGQCIQRTALNAVYAGVDVHADGTVEVDAAPLDPVHEACVRDVLQRELSRHRCEGSVAFRYRGPGFASSLR